MQLLRGVWGHLHITMYPLVLLVECSSLRAFGVIYTSKCITSTTSRMQLLRGVWGELHITIYPSTTSRMQLPRGVWGELHITMYP